MCPQHHQEQRARDPRPRPRRRGRPALRGCRGVPGRTPSPRRWANPTWCSPPSRCRETWRRWALGEGGIGESARQGTVHIGPQHQFADHGTEHRGPARAERHQDARRAGERRRGRGREGRPSRSWWAVDRAVFEECRPPLRIGSARTSFITGDLGSGSIAKIVNNMVAFCNMASGAEGLMLGAAAGIDPDVLNQVIRNSEAATGSGTGRLPTRRSRATGAPRSRSDLAYKDMHLALELAGRDRHSAAARGPDPQPHAHGPWLGLWRRRHDGR